MKSLVRFSALPIALAAVLALAAAPSVASAEGKLTGLLEDYRTLRLAEAGIPVSERSATLGHLELTLSVGTVFPLTTPGGEVLGFYFEGQGVYSYRSEDAADRQVMEANFQSRSNAKIYGDYVIHDAIDRMLLFFGRPVLDPLWERGDGAPAGGGVTHADADRHFQEIWKRVMQSYLQFDHLAAQARLNGGDGQYVYAEIEGKNETVGYSFDRVRSFEERLFLFRKISGWDIRFHSRVSNQPIDGGPAVQPAIVRLEKAALDIATDDNKTGRFTSDLTFRSGVPGLRVVPLALINNRDPGSYDWSSKKNEMRVVRVADPSGNELSYSHRYHEILVELPEPAEPGTTFTLHFETEGEMLTDMSGSRADNYFELMSDSWYPEPMGWANSDFTFTLRAKTHKPYRPIASGTLKSFREDGDEYVLETESTKPVQLIAVFAGKYKTQEEKFDGVTVRVHAYAMARKQVMENLPKLAWAFVSFYQNLLGPYPFDELDIIEVPEYGFGIAPSGTVLITTEAYKPRQDYLASYFSRGVNSRLAHEIAHQWFGHVAMPATPRDNWLSESFAEYLSGLAMAAAGADERKVQGFKLIFEDWWACTKEIREAGPIEAANMLSGPSAGRDRFYLLYARGPLVLRMLHSMVGNERFYAVLQRFLKNANMGPVTTEDFAKAAREVLGADIGWFLDQWIGHGGIPEVKVEQRIESVGGGTVLVGRAVQESGPEFKKLFIPLVLDYGKGRQELRVVDMQQPATEFRFDIPGRPKKVEVDPARNTLALYK